MRLKLSIVAAAIITLYAVASAGQGMIGQASIGGSAATGTANQDTTAALRSEMKSTAADSNLFRTDGATVEPKTEDSLKVDRKVYVGDASLEYDPDKGALVLTIPGSGLTITRADGKKYVAGTVSADNDTVYTVDITAWSDSAGISQVRLVDPDNAHEAQVVTVSTWNASYLVLADDWTGDSVTDLMIEPYGVVDYGLLDPPKWLWFIRNDSLCVSDAVSLRRL
jgi:hypothetical protein